MPAAVPLPIRQAIWGHHQKGATASQLSLRFDIPARTVRHLLKRWRDRGEGALAPDYHRAPTPPPPPTHPAFEPAIRLRQAHPSWGAGLIRVYLENQGVRPLPSERTLQRWFARAGLGPAPAGRKPASAAARATAPHEVWQVDAAEEIALAGGQRVCWLRIVDEFSGAVLHTAVFPPGALERGARIRDAGAAARRLPALGRAASRARR